MECSLSAHAHFDILAIILAIFARFNFKIIVARTSLRRTCNSNQCIVLYRVYISHAAFKDKNMVILTFWCSKHVYRDNSGRMSEF